MITVKKYGNRRLYDTTRSCYINLEQLADLVKAGQEVRVLDARTGDDLTREVLMQVLLEVLKPGDLFPVEMLRRIIVATGSSPYQTMFRQQLSSGMRLLNTQMEAFERMFSFGANYGQTVPPPPGPPEPPPEDDPLPPVEEPKSPPPAASPLDDLLELQRRMAELERKLSGASKA